MMKSRIHVFALVLVTLLFGTMSSAQVQKKAKMTPAEIMAALKPGQWVQMEGIVQRDFTVNTSDIEVLTGDFLDDDWSVEALTRSIDPSKQEFKMLLLPIKTQETTEYKAKRSLVATFTRFADLKEDMYVEVDGTYQKDGTFLALEIEDKSADLKDEPGLENVVETVGKVEKLDPAKRTVKVMGITFHIVPNETELKTAVK